MNYTYKISKKYIGMSTLYRSGTVIALKDIQRLSYKLTHDELDHIPYTNYYVDWNTYTTLLADYPEKNLCHKSTKSLREHLNIVTPCGLYIHQLPEKILVKLAT